MSRKKMSRQLGDLIIKNMNITDLARRVTSLMEVNAAFAAEIKQKVEERERETEVLKEKPVVKSTNPLVQAVKDDDLEGFKKLLGNQLQLLKKKDQRKDTVFDVMGPTDTPFLIEIIKAIPHYEEYEEKINEVIAQLEPTPEDLRALLKLMIEKEINISDANEDNAGILETLLSTCSMESDFYTEILPELAKFLVPLIKPEQVWNPDEEEFEENEYSRCLYVAMMARK